MRISIAIHSKLPELPAAAKSSAFIKRRLIWCHHLSFSPPPHSLSLCLSLSHSLLLCMRDWHALVCLCVCGCVGGWLSVYSTGILSMLRFAFFFLKIKFNLPGVKAERGNINTLFTFRSFLFASSSCKFYFLFHYVHSRGVGGAVATELEHLCDLFAQLVVASTITDKRIKSLLALIVVFTTLC